jgi:hypothetical protein
MPAPQARSLNLPPGDELPSSIAEKSAPLGPDAWVQAVGHVEAVELRVASEGADPVRALRGRFTLVSLVGPARGPLSATLARSTDSGLELLGGVLVRARSAGVSVLLTPATALDETAAAPDPGRPAPRPVQPEPRPGVTQPEPRASAPQPEPRPSAAPPAASLQAQPQAAAQAPATPLAPPIPAPAMSAAAAAAAQPLPLKPPTAQPTTSWGQVAQASERDEDEDEDEEHLPVPGDLVDHFSFGLCEVVTSDGERLRIRDLRGPGRIREISLSMLNVARPTTSNNKRLFRLMRK